MTAIPRHYATSAELCETVRRELGDTCLLAFSGGKDAIAAWLQLRDRGFKHIVPYHLYLVPGLEFVERGLAYYEKFFGTTVIRMPHPSLPRMMSNLVFQPPERAAIIERHRWPRLTYPDIYAHAKRLAGLPAETYVAIGTRAADSPIRLGNIRKHGALNPNAGTFLPVFDWRIADVEAAIRRAGVRLSVEYRWFSRSFDGIDWRFLEPIKRHAPRDYARILEMYPLAELELTRRNLGDPHGQAT